jgi:hypothetical protein
MMALNKSANATNFFFMAISFNYHTLIAVFDYWMHFIAKGLIRIVNNHKTKTSPITNAPMTNGK